MFYWWWKRLFSKCYLYTNKQWIRRQEGGLPPASFIDLFEAGRRENLPKFSKTQYPYALKLDTNRTNDSPIRLFLWHLDTGTLFLLPSFQQLITFNPSRPASTDTFDSYPILKSLLIFTIQGSTADYRDCTFLVQPSSCINIIIKKKKEKSIRKYYKGKTFPINFVLLEVVSYLFLDCLTSNPEL